MLATNKQKSYFTVLDLPVGPWKYFDQIFEEPGNIYIGEDIFTSEKTGYSNLLIINFCNLSKYFLIYYIVIYN